VDWHSPGPLGMGVTGEMWTAYPHPVRCEIRAATRDSGVIPTLPSTTARTGSPYLIRNDTCGRTTGWVVPGQEQRDQRWNAVDKRRQLLQNPATGETMAAKRDITHLVERLEAFEERVGIELGAIYATVAGPDDDDEYYVEVNGEIQESGRGSLQDSLTIVMAVYDSEGRVIKTGAYFVSADSFLGFDTFGISVYAPLVPGRIRLYPQL
jgi:hypothetical protein